MTREGIYLFEKWRRGEREKYLALSTSALTEGLLHILPAPALTLYLLFFAFADHNNQGKVTFSDLHMAFPIPPDEIEQHLANLIEKGLLKVNKQDTTYIYSVFSFSDVTTEEGPLAQVEQEERFLNTLLSGRPVSEQELVKGLVLILAPDKLTPSLREEIEDIMASFSPEMVRELIRRVRKAVSENPDIRPLPYLRAIIREWYRDDIFTYEDLQRADRLHRETYALATAFGLQRAREMTPAHKETILSWITQKDEDDFALSLEVAKFAIHEAIRRKRDGRPSLNYIEQNFILPWKKARVTTPEEAIELLSSPSSGKKAKRDKTKKTWDYEELLDN